ncbi:MAG: DUF4942 domain-containing protein [Bacteroidetes bacterium]|nr:DUF4942 domain-containing protein [Bacteroidota bacterium]
MFNAEFFPTPKWVIRKMIEPYLKGLHERVILDPEAGKGDILDYIADASGSYCPPKMYCGEINRDLQFILSEKKYRLITEDFLKYSGDLFFDLIVMNPPFSNGVDHLLKAWEILDEGDICCLLNAETILNPHTEKRKLLATIIKDNAGEVEHLGQCFKDAERTTQVDVAMVRLKKVSGSKRVDFEFKSTSSEPRLNLDENIINDAVATRDVIGNMVLRFEQVKELFVEHLKVTEGIRFYSNGLTSTYDKFMDEFGTSGANKLKYNEFCDHLRTSVWKQVITQMGMERYMTHNVRSNFNQFIVTQGAMDFTKENVMNLIRTLLLNKETILEQAVVEVFNMLTKYHDENRCHVEGWKTNDKWKVNKKLILPNWVKYGAYMSSHDISQYGDNFGTNYSYDSEYSDIDKVMCYISGTKYEKCLTIRNTLEHKFHELGKVYSGTFSNTCESEFFDIKFFKKGTVHLTFKDEFLWQEFNMRACDGKQWLPESEKKTWQESKVQDKQTLFSEVA